LGAVGGEFGDASTESMANDQDTTVESDVAIGRRTARDLKTFFCQPVGDFVELLLGDAIATGVFLWRQPFVILRRLWVLLFGQQFGQLVFVVRLEPNLE